MWPDKKMRLDRVYLFVVTDHAASKASAVGGEVHMAVEIHVCVLLLCAVLQGDGTDIAQRLVFCSTSW